MRQKAIVARSARSQPALGGGHLARQFIRTADNTQMSCRPRRPTPNGWKPCVYESAPQGSRQTYAKKERPVWRKKCPIPTAR